MTSFWFLLNHPGFQNTLSVVEYSFSDGKKSSGKLRTLRMDLGVAPRCTLSEFASGYGCVIRHSSSALPGLSVVFCDIHQDVIEFITIKLAVHAVPSHRDPSALKLGATIRRRFCVIGFFAYAGKYLGKVAKGVV